MTNDYFFNQEPNPAVETYKQDVRARKKTFARAGWALMVLLLVTYVMQYALIFALGWLWPEALTTWWVNWVLSFVPLYLFGLPAFFPEAHWCNLSLEGE